MVNRRRTGLPTQALAEAGQVSRLLLVLAVVILVAVIIVYLVMRMAEKPPEPQLPVTPGQEQPTYEKQLGEIRFVFQSALNMGSVMTEAQIIDKRRYGSAKPITTKEKFIKVTVGAQNKGLENTERNAWTIENIVDADGRNFVPLSGSEVGPWLPSDDQCGELLKPAFDPTPCTKIYEVAKGSTGLKVRIATGKGNKASNLSGGNKDIFLLDLIVK